MLIYIFAGLLLITLFLLLSYKECQVCHKYHPFWQIKDELICVECKANIIILCLVTQMEYQTIVEIFKKEREEEQNAKKNSR